MEINSTILGFNLDSWRKCFPSACIGVHYRNNYTSVLAKVNLNYILYGSIVVFAFVKYVTSCYD
jgi:hypothetical protein